MWKDWLSFSRNEQYGIFLLFAIVLILLLVRLLLPLFFRQDVIVLYNYYEDVVSVDIPEVSARGSRVLSHDNRGGFASFNPNDVSAGKLKSMGVSDAAIINWLKYLEAGGRFLSGAEIRKVYGLDSVLAGRLIRYANCQLKPGGEISREGREQDLSLKHGGNEAVGKEGSLLKPSVSEGGAGNRDGNPMQVSGAIPKTVDHIMVELNASTAGDLMKFRGVGPVLSKRIVDFRNALGGFFSVTQVKEVYGVSDELYAHLEKYLLVDKSSIKVLDVNRTPVRTLKYHPYIDFYQARDMVEYRLANGSLRDFDDLKKLPSFNEMHIKRLRPYLIFGSDSLNIEKNQPE